MFYHALTGGNTPTEDLEPVLLWTNSNPTAAFTAQTVSLDLTDYVGVIVEFYDNDTRLYVKKDDTDNTAGHYTVDASYTRKVTINDNGATITEGYVFGSNNETKNNNVLLPYKIYGVKDYVVEPEVGNLLWTNPAPTASFGAQKISVDLANAKGVIIECMVSYNTQLPNTRVLIYKGNTPFGIGYSAGTTATSRNVTAVENDGVTFATGYTGASEDGGALIPYKIYAIN